MLVERGLCRLGVGPLTGRLAQDGACGLHRLGELSLLCDGGLLGQGPELAVELVRQVGDAGQVGCHGVELAQGALLA
ncbi:hypothetical protein, partial [Actinomyces denticolens]|uniref:hypothetical protein n=1 Tax=Actinomyces denticolens TaxID=52767 RepID=UPI00196AF134